MLAPGAAGAVRQAEADLFALLAWGGFGMSISKPAVVTPLTHPVSFKEGEQPMTTRISNILCRGLLLATVSAVCMAHGQAPVITSFTGNGALVCSNLVPGSVATVEWAPAATGPWTNTWDGLAAVTADSNGTIQVSVPMFYRMLAMPQPTNSVRPTWR